MNVQLETTSTGNVRIEFKEIMNRLEIKIARCEVDYSIEETLEVTNTVLLCRYLYYGWYEQCIVYDLG